MKDYVFDGPGSGPVKGLYSWRLGPDPALGGNGYPIAEKGYTVTGEVYESLGDYTRSQVDNLVVRGVITIHERKRPARVKAADDPGPEHEE